MKKTVSFVLSLGLTLSVCAAMAVPASAAAITAVGSSQSENIKGTYVAGNTPTVYSVDVTWGSMEFTYTDGSKGTWNPSIHAYENPTASAWSCTDGANKITVTNHSNTAVNAHLSFTADNTHTDIKAAFYEDAAFTLPLAGVNNDVYLETADTYTVNTIDGPVTFPAGARTKEGYMKITDGSLSSGTNAVFGFITVTLAEDESC